MVNPRDIAGERKKKKKKKKIIIITRDVHPFKTDTKGGHSVDVCVNWSTNRNWQTKLLDTRK